MIDPGDAHFSLAFLSSDSTSDQRVRQASKQGHYVILSQDREVGQENARLTRLQRGLAEVVLDPPSHEARALHHPEAIGQGRVR